ncbi:hypothetical protein C485_17962 [Natrinema altunense JCM 12890]|uniref:Uncharacterized protein n=1 Tax=Natrinema altunense (strain JCM 12890 / CGMCC 1.3731 / AJ2) TaxID=1227494 RepID=L9ZEP9_NATA2|nr:hypothetical protein C485_17962 [Natrinema altunense JCM 12890]
MLHIVLPVDLLRRIDVVLSPVNPLLEKSLIQRFAYKLLVVIRTGHLVLAIIHLFNVIQVQIYIRISHLQKSPLLELTTNRL